MNFFSRALLACSLLFICIIAEGQTTTPANPFGFRTDLIPPSPNAAALGKYGIVPVSLQTGIPNISIPITEAGGQQLKLPITLNYHYNGCKPSEEASWVGLGWSLDAGGMITRIVRDKIDESLADAGKYENTSWRFNTRDSVTNNFMDEALYFGTVDTEPDIYAFNFAGHSGKFVLYKGKVYQYPYQQLSIGGDPANGFTIVTPEGDIYTFDLPETTQALTNHILNPDNPYYILPSTFTSSWYLRKIQSANNKDQINFTYAPADAIAQNSPAVQNMKELNPANPNYTVDPMFFPFPVSVQSLRLATISTSKMLIKFNSSATARLDISKSYALDNIEIYDYQGALVNRFVFQTAYFGSSGVNNSWLKLTGLLEQGNGSQPAKKYSFQYNETTGWPGKKLPHVDHWGYFNGGGDISTTAYLLPIRDYNGYSVYPQGIDKTPNFQYSQLGVLKKMIYPTGGSSVFTFEPNLTYNGLSYVTNPMQLYVEAMRADTTTTNIISSYGSFTLSSSQLVHITTTRTPKIPVDPNDPNNNLSSPTKDFTPVLQITGPQSYSVVISSNSGNTGKLDSVQLQAGTYSVQVQCSSKCNDATALIKYIQVTNQVIEGRTGPGIRIKSIANYADSLASGTPLSIKQYSYKDSTGVSTGVLLNTPSYGGRNYKEITYSSPLVTDNYINYTSANGNGLNLSQEIYYKTVYEQQMNGSDYLLSKSEFNLFDPLIENGTNVFLSRKTDFKGTVGNGFTKVQKQEYTYSQVQDSDFFAIKPYLIEKAIQGNVGFPPDSARIYSYDTYEIIPTWLRLNSEKQTNYYNTSDSVVTTKSYGYDSPARNIISTTTTDSKGATRIERSKYRENYGINVFTPGINSVVERQEWLKRSATDSVLVNGIITQYHSSFYKPLTLYGFESVIPVSSLNQESKNTNGLYTSLISDSRYQPRLYNTYDSATGNLVAEDQITSPDTTHQVNILWGYHNNYPIAQVKNAKASSIAYTSFEDDDNSWTYSSSSVNSSDSRTGVKCYSGTISKAGLKADNYILSLWAKGSGSITVGGVAKTTTATWALYQWQLNNITSVTVNSGSSLIDEVRLCPLNAQMTTYTYNPQIGITSSDDAKGEITSFEYDPFLRLMNIRDKDGNIIKHYDYHYQGQ